MIRKWLRVRAAVHADDVAADIVIITATASNGVRNVSLPLSLVVHAVMRWRTKRRDGRLRRSRQIVHHCG